MSPLASGIVSIDTSDCFSGAEGSVLPEELGGLRLDQLLIEVAHVANERLHEFLLFLEALHLYIIP